MAGSRRAGLFGPPAGFLPLNPDLSAEDAAAVLVAPLPAIVATANRVPRADFSKLMIPSRSALGIVPPTLTAFPSNSARDPGVLKLSSAALRSFVQPA